MKLYYDMLVPYMPDAIKNDQGELVHDNQRAAGRSAMIELSKYQKTNDPMCLYQAVIYACTYAGKDLVDTILNIPEEIEFEDGTKVDDIIDNCVKDLFRSIRDHDFNVDLFVATMLTVAHAVLETMENQQKDSKAEE